MEEYCFDSFIVSNPNFPKRFSVCGISLKMTFEKAWQTYGRNCRFSPSGAPSANSKKVWRKYGVTMPKLIKSCKNRHMVIKMKKSDLSDGKIEKKVISESKLPVCLKSIGMLS